MERIPRIAILLTWAAAAVVVAVTMSPAASTASPNACDEYGNTSPTQLARKEARKAIRCLVNAQREVAGLKSLKRNGKLQRAAQRHNARMVGDGCFAHACPGEPGLDGRLDLVGYLAGRITRWLFGENLGWGAHERGTPAAIVAGWMASPSHRATMLHSSFRELGVGFSTGTTSHRNAAGGVYTADFGLRRG